MLEPLFDKNCELVGWISPREHIFDVNLNWVAYIKKNNAWSVETGNWLGPVKGLLCYDSNGKVVAWNPKEHVVGITRPTKPPKELKPPRPLRPLKPLTPPKPLRPPVPTGGWSELTFWNWLSQ